MSDKLIFYSKSKDVYPGKGKGEYIKIPSDYKKLGYIKDWRKVLSNFYITSRPFLLDGQLWDSVEAYYHASKFFYTNPEYSLKFVHGKAPLDSGKVKNMGGKTASKKNCVVMDPEFYTRKIKNIPFNEWVMFRAQISRFFSDEKSRKILLLTNDAELWHFLSRVESGKNLIRFKYLEKIRRCIKLFDISTNLDLSDKIDDVNIMKLLNSKI